MAYPLFSAKPLSEPMLTYWQLDPWEQTSVKFQSKFCDFHSRNCISKCHLLKWWPFCSGFIVLNGVLSSTMLRGLNVFVMQMFCSADFLAIWIKAKWNSDAIRIKLAKKNEILCNLNYEWNIISKMDPRMHCFEWPVIIKSGILSWWNFFNYAVILWGNVFQGWWQEPMWKLLKFPNRAFPLTMLLWSEILLAFDMFLTHCGPVMPHGIIGFYQHWFR